MPKLLCLAALWAVCSACVFISASKRVNDDEIFAACVDRELDTVQVTFAIDLRAQCMFEISSTCEATRDGDVVSLTGTAVWREKDTFCSNTVSRRPVATCDLPDGWQDALFEANGVEIDVPDC